MKVALLSPSGIVKDEAGEKVTVPNEELVRVTVVLPVVMGVLSGICRCTVMVPVGTPAVVVIAEEVNTNFFGRMVSTCVALSIGALAAVRVGVPPCVSV